MPIPFAPLTCEPDCTPAWPGLHPPQPRLVTLPPSRVCNCGRLMSRRERVQECCDVCAGLHILPLVPFAPGVA